MAKDDLTKGQKDQVEHYEDAHYRQDFTPNPADESMIGHNHIAWLQNECKRLVKERDEAQARSSQLQGELDRVKKDNNDLFNRVADALAVDESHQKLNGKLQVRIAELEDDNKKISRQIEDQLDRARKAGM